MIWLRIKSSSKSDEVELFPRAKGKWLASRTLDQIGNGITDKGATARVSDKPDLRHWFFPNGRLNAPLPPGTYQQLADLLYPD